MRLAFIVSTVGGRLPELHRLLQCLEEEAPGCAVVIADQSHDGAVAGLCAGFPGVRIIPSSGGLSRGRNDCLASGAFDGEAILMFPNDNTWYPPGLLREVETRMTGLGLDVLAGRLVYDDGSSPFPVPQGRTVLHRDNAALAMSTTLAIRASSLLGGLRFNEALGTGAPTPYQAGEETDLLLKILANGGRSELHGDLVVRGTDATRALPMAAQIKKTWAYSRAHSHVLRLHAFPVRAMALALVRPLVRSIVSLVALDVRQSVLAMTRFLGRCRGLVS